MAEFNPSPQPEQTPPWLFYSRQDRENPRPNESSAILEEGSGRLLEGGAKLVDAQMEQSVRDKVFNTEQNERDAFNAAANSVQQQQQQQRNQAQLDPDALLYSQGGGILNTNPVSSAPQPVQQTINNVQRLNAGRDQGKVDEKYYLQRVIPQLQAIRQQYPGYRDVVDPALGNAANRLMQTYVSELNQQRSDAKAEHSQLMSEAFSAAKAGYLGAHPEMVMAALENGTLNRTQLMSAMAPMIRHDLEMKAFRDSQEVRTGTDKQLGDDATSYANQRAAFTLNSGAIWPNVIAKAGVQNSGLSMNDHIAALRDAANNPGKYDSNVTMGHAAAVNTMMGQMYQSFVSDMNQPIKNDPQGRSYAAVLGPEKMKQIWDAQSGPTQAILAGYGDPKTYATAHAAANIVENQTRDDVLKANQDPKIAPVLRTFAATKSTVGDQGMPFVMPNLIGKSEFSQATDAMVKLYHFGMINQPTRPDGKPYTPGEAITEKAVYQTPAAVKDLLGDINLLSNHQVGDQARLNIARGFFAPTDENRAMISKFNLDTWDPKTHKYVNGANTAFQAMTNPAVTHEIMRFKDADLSKNYQNTVDAWFNNIFGRDISNLRDSLQHEVVIRNSRGSTSNTKSNNVNVPEIKLVWDPVNHELDFTPEARHYLMMTRQRPILDSLTRLNGGLRNMSHIVETVKAEGYPRDANAYVLDVLKNHELIDPSVKPVTDMIRTAVVAGSKVKPQEDIPN